MTNFVLLMTVCVLSVISVDSLDCRVAASPQPYCFVLTAFGTLDEVKHIF